MTKQISYNELTAKLTEIATKGRTTIVSMNTETVPSNFYAGKNGSRKKVDKMVELEGVSPKDFRKKSKFTCMISGKSYMNTLKALASKELDSLKVDMQLKLDDVDMQLKLAEMIEAKKALNENVEAKERKNGTTLNGIIGISSKDEMPLLRAYCRSANKPQTNYFLNDVEVDIKKGKWSEYVKPYKPSVSSTCKELGLTEEPFPLRDFRYESIKEITIDGETYTLKA